MKHSLFRLILLFTLALPLTALAQSPSQDCNPDPGAVSEISVLPFFQASTGAWSDSYDFNVDIGAACPAGNGGDPAGSGGDFVYRITLLDGHNVECSFTSNVPENSADWVFVLSRSCQDPLGAAQCAWGELVPEGDVGTVNTSDLDLAPGTYFLWLDRGAGPTGPNWELTCRGRFGALFEDGFESAEASTMADILNSP